MNTACANRSVQLPFGTATVLPSSHFSASSEELNCRRIGANQEDVALVVAKAEHRNDADIADVRMAGRDDAGHVADVTDVDFPGEHAVDNDCALETDLETDVRSLRQVFLVELFVAHDHARP